MKFRITQHPSPVDGSPLFNVYYQMPTPTWTSIESPWVYWTYRYTEKEARDLVNAAIKEDLADVPVDVLVGEFDSENRP